MERHSAFHVTADPIDIHGSPRQLAILDLLNTYDLLPSTYIRTKIPKFYCNDTLTLLVKGHYIGLHPEARNQLNARSMPYVYQLLPRGRAMLARHGRAIKTKGNDHYKHMLLRSQIEFLCDHSPFDVKSPAHILNHPLCPEATRSLSNPWRLPTTPSLEPDITRGFSQAGKTLFVHIEVDRNTEPLTTRNADRQSLKDKIVRYDTYLGQQLYKAHLGLPSIPLILILTTNEARMETAALLVERYALNKPERFKFVCVPENPPPTFDFFDTIRERLNAPRNQNHQGEGPHRAAREDRPGA